MIMEHAPKPKALRLVCSFAAISLAAVLSTPAAANCGVRADGVNGVALGDFNPLVGRDLSRDMTFNLSGPINSRAWVRVQISPDRDQLGTEFYGLTNTGLARVDGGVGQALASDLGSLNAAWLPVGFDAQGRATARFTARVPETAYASAGTMSQAINLAVACVEDGLIQVDDFPLTVGELSVRVVSAIRVSDASSNTLRFGSLPDGNPEGYSPSSARAYLSVTSTGGFDVKLSSSDWFLRNVSLSGGAGRDTIPFSVTMKTESGTKLDQPSQTLQCEASSDRAGTRSLALEARLPANATQGKLAGLYRGHIMVDISPLELVVARPNTGCSAS
jgi:hypothetical protein